MQARAVLKVVAAIALTVLLVPWPASAETRAYPYDAPDGTRYYIYVHGGEGGVQNHSMQLWSETNKAPTACAGVPQGLPIGHVTPTDGETELQVTPFWCDPDGSGPAPKKYYAADTKVSP